jgi:tripartite-type tricarboxylate transporter receptor subunit TctC
MITRRQMCVAMAALPLPWPSLAQQFPSRPLTFLVPFGPAAGADMLARSLAQGMARHIGQTPIVDNRPGGNGFIGTQAVLTAPGDGHTVLVTSNSHVLNKLLFRKVPYDPVKDFTPVASLCSGTLVLTASGKSSFQSAAELVDFARKNPGKVTVGVSSSATRLAAALFQQVAGIQLLEVPYKAFVPAVTDQIGGQIDALFPPAELVSQHIKSGALRALGVTGKRRMASLPDVPTLQESGIAYDFTFWYGAWVKAGTPPAVIQSLRDALLRALDEPEAKKFLASNDFEPLRMSREDFGRFQEQDLDRWATVMKKAGIQPE